MHFVVHFVLPKHQKGQAHSLHLKYFVIIFRQPGLELIKLEYSLRLKIKRNDWLHADTCPQAANHCTLLKSENELKFYNMRPCNYNMSSKAICNHRLCSGSFILIYMFYEMMH